MRTTTTTTVTTTTTTSVRADSPILEEIKFCGHKATPEILRCHVYGLQWAMQSHVIILSIDTTGTTYTIYEIVKRKEAIKGETKTKQTNRKKKRKKKWHRIVNSGQRWVKM